MKRHRRTPARQGKRVVPRGARAHGGAKDPRVERAKNMAALLWTAFPIAAFLILAGAADRAKFDPSATDYGKNWPGDLQRTLLEAAIGTVVLVMILRPWSFRDSTGRLALAAALFVPWTAFSLLTSTHTGEIIGALLFWLLMVCFALVWGFVKVEAARRSERSEAPSHG
jgi:hypothetical protein